MLQGGLLVEVDDLTGTEGSDQTKKLTPIKVLSFISASLLKTEQFSGFIQSLAVSYVLNIFFWRIILQDFFWFPYASMPQGAGVLLLCS